MSIVHFRKFFRLMIFATLLTFIFVKFIFNYHLYIYTSNIFLNYYCY